MTLYATAFFDFITHTNFLTDHIGTRYFFILWLNLLNEVPFLKYLRTFVNATEYLTLHTYFTS